jgi:hypothetical protein
MNLTVVGLCTVAWVTLHRAARAAIVTALLVTAARPDFDPNWLGHRAPTDVSGVDKHDATLQ